MMRQSLLLISLILVGGASLPPGSCGTAPAPGSALPNHLDMAGSAGGSISPSVSVLTPNLTAPRGMDCGRPTPGPATSSGASASAGTSALGNESADILHGLPSAERLRSPFESQRLNVP